MIAPFQTVAPPCIDCHGTGTPEGDYKPCPTCYGTGNGACIDCNDTGRVEMYVGKDPDTGEREYEAATCHCSLGRALWDAQLSARDHQQVDELYRRLWGCA